MEQRTQIDNSIFISAFAGVVLLIGSLALSLVMSMGSHSTTLPYVISSVASGVTAVALLAHSVKKERESSNYTEQF